MYLLWKHIFLSASIYKLYELYIMNFVVNGAQRGAFEWVPVLTILLGLNNILIYKLNTLFLTRMFDWKIQEKVSNYYQIQVRFCHFWWSDKIIVKNLIVQFNPRLWTLLPGHNRLTIKKSNPQTILTSPSKTFVIIKLDSPLPCCSKRYHEHHTGIQKTCPVQDTY